MWFEGIFLEAAYGEAIFIKIKTRWWVHNDLQNFVVIKFKTCFIFYFWTCFGPLGIFLIWFQLFYKCIKCSTYLSNILLRRKLFIVNGCCHRLVYSSAPTIRPPRVWIPNLTFIYSQIRAVFVLRKRTKKRPGLAHMKSFCCT